MSTMQDALLSLTAAVPAGYTKLLGQLEARAADLLPWEGQSCKLQATFCQDSSVKVRRSAFHAWVDLQRQHWAGAPECGSWEESQLRALQERCTDRFVPTGVLQWLGSLLSVQITQPYHLVCGMYLKQTRH